MQHACGVFIDLQKVFHTVNYDILLRKPNYYGIRGITNNWFRFYLQDRIQFTSVNGHQSNMRQLKYGVPQGSVLGSLLFILFVSDFHLAVQYSFVDQFADDTNLLVVERSLKQLNKNINRDVKPTVEWLRANKLSLNTKNTDIIIFKPRTKTIMKHLNFRISGQKITLTNQVKYLGVLLQEDLHWSKYLSNLGKKLNPSFGLLSKVRHYVLKLIVRRMFFSNFNSYCIYACEIWDQNQNRQHFKKLLKLQEKALQIINFQPPTTATTNHLFLENKILKIVDFIKYRYALFVRSSLRKGGVLLFRDMFTTMSHNHNHIT